MKIITYDTEYSENSIKRTLRDLPKCPLNRGCKNCVLFLTINIQRLLCAVIKFHVVKKAIQGTGGPNSRYEGRV